MQMTKNIDLPRLRSSIKTKDGWWASIFAGPLANRLLEPIAECGFITPNRVTLFSLFLGLLASLCFLQASHPWLICGAILVQLSFAYDCADGQLARYRQQFSTLGAWLDRISDRVKDFFYYFSLSLGFFLSHRPVFELHFYRFHVEIESWIVFPLAMIASFTVFLIDYYVNQDMKLASVTATSRLNTASSSLGALIASDKREDILSRVLSFGRFVYRKVPILRFNIGEQSLVLSLFCMFDAVFFLLAFVAFIGSFYSLYWPIAKLKGYTEAK